ncbi:uncharacterized protein LOC115444532 isoform X2 [Manduca sexta]|uniref:uncharacterized protein LOC115444532 isoform X2 n=1 Tax=Manduca sexta TaxID=7130 RepID=UPI0011829E14|nr:uncharacterized protein LOC115444532 isoform X2 [Manduca sexta]
MGMSKKSNGRKTDQETQSPMLKIFKDIIQRDKDPEKTTLLKEHHEDRKKRHYSTSKPKKSESSSSERSKKTVSYKTQETRNLEYEQCRPRSTPFQSDRKESWWFWGDPKTSNRDTRSCVSCVLKRLGGSEYFCVGCLLLIFAVSVVVAFLLVFRSVPTIAAVTPVPGMLESDRLRRKMDALNEKKKDLKKGDSREKREWDNSVWKNLEGQGSLSRTDFGQAGYNDMVSIDENGKSELSNVIDTERMEDIRSNDRLRDFFKKLVETDAQIRLLRKGMQRQSFSTDESEKSLKKLLERSKRSVKTNRTKIANKNKHEIFGKGKNTLKSRVHRPFYILRRGKTKNARNKRNPNNGEPTGYFIEKKKVLVQYMPIAETKKIPKCSHAPKDSKSHETLLKHPFYKNTQRLDEMLDQFIANNFHEIMGDPYALDLLMKKKKEKCKHPIPHKYRTSAHNKVKEKMEPNVEKIYEQKISDEEISKLLQPLVTTALLEKDSENLEVTKPKETTGSKSTSDNYDIVLSISTILSPDMPSVTPSTPFGRNYVFRKLMQVDEEDEEGIGYEDLNEVLAEDTEAHDERDNSVDRKKRDELTQLPQVQNVPNPTGVSNRNWKGAMPLYPDEINSMIKQAALNANKLVYLKNKEGKDIFLPKDASSEAEDENDVQYIEEYFNSKYNRLVNMAQAYSDYGVLDGKRNGVGTEKTGDQKILEHRVKLSADGALVGSGLFGRLKKRTRPSEGIRFELRPTAPSTAREDPPLGMSKLLHKHLKISPENCQPPNAPGSSMLPPSEMEFMYSPTKFEKPVIDDDSKKKPKSEEDDGFMFSFHKGQRSLKSIDGVDDYSNENEDDESITDEAVVDIIHNGETGITLFNYFENIPFHKINIDSDYNGEVKKLCVKRDVKLKHDLLDNELIKQKNNIISNNGVTKYNHGTKGNSNVEFKVLTDEKGNIGNPLNSNVFSTPYTKPNVSSGTNIDISKLVENGTELHNTSLNGTNSNTTKPSDDGMDLIDLFMMFTNLFNYLDFDIAQKINANLNTTTIERKDHSISNSTSQTTKAMNGPNISENIVHRSRMLLSVDNATIENIDEESTAKEQITKATESDKTTTIKSTTPKEANTTQLKIDKNIATTITVRVKQLKNKTLVKRNADDSNLIFWNDIYDDEYGVRVEPEETVRDKHSVPKAPGTWFKDKLKRLTDNMRKKSERRTIKRRILRNAQRFRNFNRKGRSVGRLYKRDLKLVESDEFQPDRSFATLNANMKEVCKKAARAVQQVKNLEVKEDTKESAASTSLMQQLVKLMTDLVDYQVQQKTCLQLPPDLQDFLEWLTGPNQEGTQDTGYKRSFQDDFMGDLEISGNDDIASFADKSTDRYLTMDMITPSTSEREEVRPEERSDCLGTLRAVQDLILKYDELSEEEKIKMAGIKEYLDNQLEYLQKYIVSIDELNYQKRDYPIRYKRNIQRKTNNGNKIKKRGKIKQRIKNVLKFNKKHTKTTRASFSQTTAVKRQDPRNNQPKSFVKPKNRGNIDPNTIGPMKRNLKDVYFKSLDDAKKVTTKSYQKYED